MDGIVSLKQKADWNIAILIPDAGPRTVYWSFCIEKPGFMPTIVQRLPSIPAGAVYDVTIAPDETEKKCRWNDQDEYMHQFEVENFESPN